MFPGETILTGAPDICRICGEKLVFKVCKSPAGYYVGTINCEGPYTRETGYGTKEQAEEWLEEFNREDYSNARR